MTSKVGRKPKHSFKQPACNLDNPKEIRKHASGTLEATQLVNKALTDSAGTRTCKMLNKTEKKCLSNHLNSVSDDTLMCAAYIVNSVAEQYLPDSPKEFTEVLFKNNQLLQSTLIYYRCRFVQLFLECQKGADSFLQFQPQ